MTKEQAILILTIYRPGIDDAADPEVMAALNLADSDRELATWLAENTALFEEVRAKLKQIEVPADGVSRALRGRPAKWFLFPAWPRGPWLAAAAGVMLLLGLGGVWFWTNRGLPHEFQTWRSGMVRKAMENYHMDFATNDLRQIREYLARNGGHTNYWLSPALEKLPGDGCGLLRWHNRPVTMICFAMREGEDLYLFIVDRAALSDPPTGAEPQFAKVGQFTTASWTTEDKTYLLAGAVDETSLRRYR